MPFGTPSRDFAIAAMNVAGSMLCVSDGLKKSGCHPATSVKAWMTSWSSSSSPACASCFNTCISTPVVCSSGVQAAVSAWPTMPQTSSRAATRTFRPLCSSPACRTWPNSCFAPTISFFKVGITSTNNLIAASQQAGGAPTAAESARRKRWGNKAGQPQAEPGAKLPLGSSLLQTCSVNLEMTSPMVVWIFGEGSASNARNSSAATCCWCA
mmetsp:Transcript_165733/g.532143  ORF Transcript_165733/g.532143 Transcript_165733/m.532143 type:complete len:211 (+) Transcript_165733:2515-3147(+)